MEPKELQEIGLHKEFFFECNFLTVENAVGFNPSQLESAGKGMKSNYTGIAIARTIALCRMIQ